VYSSVIQLKSIKRYTVASSLSGGELRNCGIENLRDGANQQRGRRHRSFWFVLF